MHPEGTIIILGHLPLQVHWSHQNLFFGSLKLEDGSQPEEISS